MFVELQKVRLSSGLNGEGEDSTQKILMRISAIEAICQRDPHLSYVDTCGGETYLVKGSIEEVKGKIEEAVRVSGWQP